MEFRFETVYNKETLTAMARALRKTVRRKRSLMSHIFGWMVLALGTVLMIPAEGENFKFDISAAVTIIALLAILVVLFAEDKLNGTIAYKRLMTGLVGAKSTFTESGYTTTLDLGKTEWHYENVGTIAENKDYFVFIFDKNHAQLYDKRSLEGGTVEEFRDFISAKTDKKIKKF